MTMAKFQNSGKRNPKFNNSQKLEQIQIHITITSIRFV